MQAYFDLILKKCLRSVLKDALYYFKLSKTRSPPPLHLSQKQ